MISATQVKDLRERTGAGMMECKKALEETDGDLEKAIDVLRSRGAAKAAKREGKETREGAIGSYVHMGGRIGVLVEVNCETDFVARTDDFQQLVRDLAMHVAAAKPLAVSVDELPADVVERERGVYREQVRNEGKPDHLADRIVEGKMKKFHQESVLLEQPFVKDPDKSISQLVTEVSARTGERISVRRFARFGIGD
jgi:elongation factor Ts